MWTVVAVRGPGTLEIVGVTLFVITLFWKVVTAQRRKERLRRDWQRHTTPTNRPEK